MSQLLNNWSERGIFTPALIDRCTSLMKKKLSPIQKTDEDFKKEEENKNREKKNKEIQYVKGLSFTSDIFHQRLKLFKVKNQ